MVDFRTELDFLAAALTRGVTCSIADLRAMDGYGEIGSLPAVKRLSDFCEHHQILVMPPLTEGELEDSRSFCLKPSHDKFFSALENCLERGENNIGEFKQTLYLNVRRQERDPNFSQNNAVDNVMVHEVIKSIGAFLNAEGGTLLIGVTDDATIFGLENEFPFCPGSRKNADGWEQYFWQKLEAGILDFGRCRGSVAGSFVKFQDREVFVVLVRPLLSQICICSDGEVELVYARNGNRSKKLTLREIEDLAIQRFISRQ